MNKNYGMRWKRLIDVANNIDERILVAVHITTKRDMIVTLGILNDVPLSYRCKTYVKFFDTSPKGLKMATEYAKKSVAEITKWLNEVQPSSNP